MSNIVIKVENLSKQYRLGEVGTGSMRDDFKRFRYRIMGKEDPFLTIGEENNRSTKSQSDYVWALKGINFEVKQGEVLGVIGRNGAGKSTLLKILSRTTGPTIGSLKMKGRIASLLEVGTGFHGELSGRENIYLNGAIMGLRKHEIRTKLDEIIDFAGIERYLDTPVKRYSSGMYVRLAFAVAAHLEPDILIVDEVLAVGDAEFQKKAVGKISEVSQNEGRTVLFVSHNLQTVQNLCPTCLYFESGKLIEKNNTLKILNSYLKKVVKNLYNANAQKREQDIFIDEAILKNETIFEDGSIFISLKIVSRVNELVSVDFKILSTLSQPVAFSSIGTLNYDEQINLKKGDNKFDFKIVVSSLAVGDYILSLDITQPNIRYFERCDECLSFEVLKISTENRQLDQTWNYGFVQLPINIL